MATQIKLRRGTALQWSSANPTLSDGEVGFETDTLKFKLGNGSSSWSSLSYSTKNISELTSSFEPKNSNIQSHISDLLNPHEVTKEQIGLGNVSNTSPIDLPISSATQSALDLKADTSSVVSSLALKADSSSVYIKGQVDSIASSTLSSANSYADTKAASIVNSAPATLDTLNELASALGNDPNFATTTATLIGTKANSSDVFSKTESSANFEPKNSNIQSHISNISNPHSVTKAQVGLSNVENTSDASKPISLATQSALDLKANSADVTSSLALKVDKISGKGLSTEDYSTAEKSKLAGIASGATANQTDSYLLSRSNHTGTQLSSTISDFTSAVQAVTIDASKIDGGNVSNLEFSYLDGVTSSIQSQLDGKQPTGNYITALTGDATASGPGSATLTLSNSGVPAGTYDQVTVDIKGRVTSGSKREWIYATTVATTNSTITYAVVTGLTSDSLPVGLYRFKVMGLAQTAATTTGIGLRVAPVTATLTTIGAKFMLSQAVDGTAKNFQVDQLATTTNVVSASSLAANTNFVVWGEGFFRVTVAGTVRVESRSEIAASNAIVQPDTMLIIEAI